MNIINTPERIDALRKPQRTGAARLLSSRVLAPVALVLLVMMLVPLHVRSYTQVGPIDELQHIDSMYKVPHIVVLGEHIGQQAMSEEACRGLDANYSPPACVASPYQPSDFQEAGFNTAYIHPPSYYAITRVLAEVISLNGRLVGLVTAARLAGAIWLAAGLMCAYAAGRRLGARPWALFGVLGLVASAPAVLYPSATVNPDAASMLVGGACLLLVMLWQARDRGGWWLLIAAGVLGEVIKLQNLLVLMVLALFVMFLWLTGRLSATDETLRIGPQIRDSVGADPDTAGSILPLRRAVLAVVAVAVPALLVAGGWTLITRALATISPDQLVMSQRFLVDHFPMENLLAPFGAFLNPLADSYVAPALRGPVQTAIATVTAALMVAGVVAASLFGLAVDRRVRALGVSMAIVGLLGATLLVVVNYVITHQYFPIPPRYALTLIPVVAVLTAVSVKRRYAEVVVSGAAVLAFVVTVVALVV